MSGIQMPQIPLRPGRPAFSKRTRRMLAIALTVVFAGILAGGAVLLHSSSKAHVVTIPVADRNASPSLLRAAEAVNFRPPHAPGVGRVEGQPASAAKLITNGLLPVGARAPAFTLHTPTGRRVALGDLRGKAVLLEFFATWCPHCNAEASHLRDLYGRLPHTKIAFVSIDGNSDDAASVFAYHVWYGLPFPAVLDQGSHTVTFPAHGPLGPVTNAYKVGEWPTFYVLDPSGKVTWRSAGEQPDALLEAELRRAAG